MTKSASEVKDILQRSGLSVSGWAKSHGFSKALVYRVLAANRVPCRGESHKIAVALGMKDGDCSDYEEVSLKLRGVENE